MRFSPLLLIFVLLTACPEIAAVRGWDPGGENCDTNTAPFIAHAQVNSTLPAGSLNWVLVFGFDWADPGASSAGDPPNLLGGELTSEIGGVSTEDIVLTEVLLEAGCSQPPGEGGTDFCQLLTLGGGCPTGGVSSCSVAALSVAGQIVGADGGESSFIEGDQLMLEFRIRDACGMTSNEKAVNYTLGSGLIIDTSDAE